MTIRLFASVMFLILAAFDPGFTYSVEGSPFLNKALEGND